MRDFNSLSTQYKNQSFWAFQGATTSLPKRDRLHALLRILHYKLSEHSHFENEGHPKVRYFWGGELRVEPRKSWHWHVEQ